ncbi:Hypothetical predicted protein [Cloeon dipterum]|uniref:Secreted protein n=1 Tax=Cloeon dipterum TaxID=197152 RepID=A0A8S1DD47_9INSE|nr:Hypothetical predicted protein [Cloeon dipterum]
MRKRKLASAPLLRILLLLPTRFCTTLCCNPVKAVPQMISPEETELAFCTHRTPAVSCWQIDEIARQSPPASAFQKPI